MVKVYTVLKKIPTKEVCLEKQEDGKCVGMTF